MSDHAETEPYLFKEMRGSVCWITLNRPRQRNPLSLQMIQALQSALDDAALDRDVRAVVIASSGPVFSAGHDLKQMSQLQEGSKTLEAQIELVLEKCATMMLSIMHNPKAVIACVQGTATAAGCQLVSACDLAIAAETANFCTPGVNLGSFCTTPLVGIGRNMHRKHAMEMALTGDMFSADDAVRMGLLNRAVAADQLEAAVTELADSIASKSARGIKAGKEAFYRQLELPIEEAFKYASCEMARAFLNEEAQEGTRAFLEKRTPSWGDAS